MAHLGPDSVRRQFKGMVERCADCGFDLAAGRVEVVPTAHYMMGGVEFATDCTTDARDSLSRARTRVASTARIGWAATALRTRPSSGASPAMRWRGGWCATANGASPILPRSTRPSRGAEAAFAAAPAPVGALDAIRERLYDVMWDDAGIVRNSAGLARAEAALDRLGDELAATGIAGTDRRFNVTWQDSQNLANLIEVSRLIVRAAQSRTDSRGAHFRDDHPASGPLDASTYTRARQHAGRLEVEQVPVVFTRVRPGASLIRD